MVVDQLIILVRHAKAIKNLEIRHGGAESELLPEAYEDLQGVFTDMTFKGILVERIVSAPLLQCKQTAEYLAEALKIPFEVHNDLVSANIGIINGLSIAEVQDKYPSIATQLDKWRTGQYEINELKIPGMIDPENYYKSLTAVLEQIIGFQKSVLIVGTLSIVITLAHYLLDSSPKPGGNYRAIPWFNSGMMCFSRKEHQTNLIQKWSTVKPEILNK